MREEFFQGERHGTEHHVMSCHVVGIVPRQVNRAADLHVGTAFLLLASCCWPCACVPCEVVYAWPYPILVDEMGWDGMATQKLEAVPLLDKLGRPRVDHRSMTNDRPAPLVSG